EDATAPDSPLITAHYHAISNHCRSPAATPDRSILTCLHHSTTCHLGSSIYNRSGCARATAGLILLLRSTELMRKLLMASLALLILPLGAGAQNNSSGANAARGGEIPDDYSSLHAITLRWLVQGDENANASVGVTYRPAGQGEWKPALDLFRVEREAMEDAAPPMGTHLFAGSIFNLQPGTEYEVKLALKDPDGGSSEKTITRTTWSEPVAPQPLRTLYVVPGDGG